MRIFRPSFSFTTVQIWIFLASFPSLIGCGTSFAEDIAGNGLVDSQCQVGKRHFTAGRFEQAAEIWLQLAKRDHVLSQLMLSEIFGRGLGVEKDHTRALDWLERAAHSGHPEAQYLVGKHYYFKGESEVETYLALDLLNASAEQKHEKGVFLLAEIYRVGEKVPADKQKAFDLYSVSAEQNNPIAQYFLALMLAKGMVGKKNEKEADKWIRKSAGNGFSEAQYELGRSLFLLAGRDSELNEAISLIEKAAAQNHEKAKHLLTQVQLRRSQLRQKKKQSQQLSFNQGCAAFRLANGDPESPLVRDAIDRYSSLEPSKSPITTKLMIAISTRQESKALRLIENNENVNETNAFGCTALMWAISLRQKRISFALLQKGANIHQSDALGRTPLMIASRRGAVDLVEKLISMGAQVDAVEVIGLGPRGFSALHHSLSTANNHAVIEALVRSGADVNLRASRRRTPLMLAASMGHLEYTALLLKLGASLDEEDSKGRNALNYAQMFQRKTVIKYLKNLLDD